MRFAVSMLLILGSMAGLGVDEVTSGADTVMNGKLYGKPLPLLTWWMCQKCGLAYNRTKPIIALSSPLDFYCFNKLLLMHRKCLQSFFSRTIKALMDSLFVL